MRELRKQLGGFESELEGNSQIGDDLALRGSIREVRVQPGRERTDGAASVVAAGVLVVSLHGLS